jgi:phasin family protein
MAKSPEIFPDMSNLMKNFDPTKFAGEFQKMIQQYKLPGVDMDALVAGQRKNMEALTAANRVAFEGVQAVARRQAEILKETMDEATKAVQSVSKSGSPTEAAAKQAEIAKNAFERALSNMRELAEMVAKSQQEAGNAINTRIAQSLDEFKDMTLKIKQ